MTLRNVELQIAIPRTQDMGKWQHEIQQRGQLIQDQLASQLSEVVLRNQQRVLMQESSSRADLKKEKSHESISKKKNEKKQRHRKLSKHPYKGNHVDYSG